MIFKKNLAFLLRLFEFYKIIFNIKTSVLAFQGASLYKAIFLWIKIS